MKPVDKITRLRFRCLTATGIEILLLDMVCMLFIGVFNTFAWSRSDFLTALIFCVFFTACGVLMILSAFFQKVYHALAALELLGVVATFMLITRPYIHIPMLVTWGIVSLVFLLPHLIYEIAWFRHSERLSALESEKEGSSL